MTRILEFAALAAGALTLALPASAQDKPEALVTTTKGVYKSRSFALAADKGLRLDNGDETRTISLNELVSIQFQGAAAARSSAGSPT
ncbi:MAG TPA: hypothetical protein VI643_01145, partial [Planctomycetota bacterium]|nr:hypothetical protein [Planctomycetota bacterium]